MEFASNFKRGVLAVFALCALTMCLLTAFSTPAHAATQGWKLKSGDTKLIYIQKDGTRAKSQTIDGITLGANGYAKSNTASKLKIAVMKKVKKLTTPNMSRREKLLACCQWVKHTGYLASEPADYGQRGWVQRTALKVMKTGRTECVAAACAIAMFAYELGYKPKVRARPNQHTICIVDGRGLDNVSAPFFDPDDGWPYKPWKEWRVVSYSDTSPKGSSPLPSGLRGKKGLTKYKGAYYYVQGAVVLTSTWKKIGKSKYYFAKDGKAAVGPKTIKGSAYVFSAKGKLLTGKKTHEVKVSGVRYRVKKNGKAAPGWNASKTLFYLSNGARATGACLIDGRLTAFSSAGTYLPTLTSELRAAAHEGDRAEALLEKLGTPKSLTAMQNSCYTLEKEPGAVGSDELYRYDHVVVSVFVTDGKRYLESMAFA